MPGHLKELMVREYQAALKGVPGMFAIRYTGLTVAATCDLRGRLFTKGSQMLHIQNRLFRKALQGIDLADFGTQVSGPSAVIYGGDVMAGIKVVAEFAKDHKTVEIRGGWFEGRVMDPAAVTELSKIPPREVLLCQVMLTARGPVQGTVNILQGLMRKLVCTVKEIEKKSQAASA
ncbi:MAG: 50S ribosomal protein L10 [Planctomycetota bacterium]